jgi:hypothetical protein
MILTPYDTCASARRQAQRHTRRQRGPGLKHAPDVNITCLPSILRGPHVIFQVRRRTFRMAKAKPSIDLRITQFVSHRESQPKATPGRFADSQHRVIALQFGLVAQRGQLRVIVHAVRVLHDCSHEQLPRRNQTSPGYLTRRKIEQDEEREKEGRKEKQCRSHGHE